MSVDDAVLRFFARIERADGQATLARTDVPAATLVLSEDSNGYILNN